MNMPQSLGNQPLPPEPPSLGTPAEGPGTTSPPEHCWPVRPTLRNELDTFSVHFYIFFGPSVALPPERPAVFAMRLLPVLDSGGVLSLELQLNAVLFMESGEVALPGSLQGKVSGVLGSLPPPGGKSLSRLLPPILTIRDHDLANMFGVLTLLQMGRSTRSTQCLGFPSFVGSPPAHYWPFTMAVVNLFLQISFDGEFTTS